MRNFGIGVGNFGAGIGLLLVPYLWLLVRTIFRFRALINCNDFVSVQSNYGSFVPFLMMGASGLLGAMAYFLVDVKVHE